RRMRPFARKGRSSPAKAQVGGIDKADAPSDRGRSVPELGLVARNRERADMKGRWGAACWRRSRGVGEDAGEEGCDVPCGDAAHPAGAAGARHASLHRESDPCEDATMRMRKGGATQEALE